MVSSSHFLGLYNHLSPAMRALIFHQSRFFTFSGTLLKTKVFTMGETINFCDIWAKLVLGSNRLDGPRNKMWRTILSHPAPRTRFVQHNAFTLTLKLHSTPYSVSLIASGIKKLITFLPVQLVPEGFPSLCWEVLQPSHSLLMLTRILC